MRISSLVTLVAFAVIGSFATSSADAQVLTKTADMNFGDVIAGGTSGTVVLTPSSSPSRSVTGGTELGNSINVSSAIFTVSGTSGFTYDITIPAGSITISSGGNNMTVNTFTSSPSGTGTLNGSGEQTLYVGATLNVGASQASGSDYSGSFDVTVVYN